MVHATRDSGSRCLGIVHDGDDRQFFFYRHRPSWLNTVRPWQSANEKTEMEQEMTPALALELELEMQMRPISGGSDRSWLHMCKALNSWKRPSSWHVASSDRSWAVAERMRSQKQR